MDHKQSLNNAFKELLKSKTYSSQSTMVMALKELGFETINQSKVSRMLSKFHAIRSRNGKGEVVYCLPSELNIPTVDSPLKDFIIDINYNHSMIVVITCLGAAHVVARLLDSISKKEGILGVVAGEDTILVSPEIDTDIPTLHASLCELFQFTP